MASVEELRAEARRLREAVNNISDPQTKQELAERALELSERAEALEHATADLWILRANVERYRALLASGKLSGEQTRVIEEMLADAEGLLGNSTKKAP